jgi:hypothetical protein
MQLTLGVGVDALGGGGDVMLRGLAVRLDGLVTLGSMRLSVSAVI